MLQVLLITLIIVVANHWWDARRSTAPAKPAKTPTPKPPFKRWELWGMGLGGLVIVVFWLVMLPIASPLLSIAIAIGFVPTAAIAYCDAKKRNFMTPPPTDSTCSPALLELPSPRPEGFY